MQSEEEVRYLHIRGDKARRQGIHVDIMLAPFVAQRLGQLADAALARRIGCDAFAADEAVQRCDVDYLAPPPRDHVFGCRLAHEKEGFQVHIDDLVVMVRKKERDREKDVARTASQSSSESSVESLRFNSPAQLTRMWISPPMASRAL